MLSLTQSSGTWHSMGSLRTKYLSASRVTLSSPVGDFQQKQEASAVTGQPRVWRVPDPHPRDGSRFAHMLEKDGV